PVIPTAVVDAFAKGDLLQVLLFSVLFGISLSVFGERAKLVRNALDEFGKVLLGIVGLVMKLAPLGAFGAMAFTIGKYGIGTLSQIGKLVACLYLTSIAFIAIVLGTVSRLSGVSLWKLVKYIKEEIF